MTAVEQEPIGVLVVDEDERFRRGLVLTLKHEADIAVVGGAADGLSAVTMASEKRPDVVLLDLYVPPGSLRAVSRIKHVLPGTKIVILAESADEAGLVDAIKAGAVGYLTKSGSLEAFAAAVRSVYAGMSVIGPSLAARLVAEFAALTPDPYGPSPPPRLTYRELAVLDLIGKGHPTAEIGRRLSLSENTVHHHVRNILDKLYLFTRMGEI